MLIHGMYLTPVKIMLEPSRFRILIFSIPWMLMCLLFYINTLPPLNSSKPNRKLLSGVIWNEQTESITHSSFVYWVLTVSIRGSFYYAATLAEYADLKCPMSFFSTYKTSFSVFIVLGTWLRSSQLTLWSSFVGFSIAFIWSPVWSSSQPLVLLHQTL